MKIQNLKVKNQSSEVKVQKLRGLQKGRLNFFFLFFLFLTFDFSLLTFDLYAGGAVAARQEAQKKMMQQRAQGQQAQKALMQQRMQYEAAAQSKMMQEKIQHEQQTILQKQNREKEIIGHSVQEKQEKEHKLAAEVKDIVDLNDLMASFETSSQAWPLIIDDEAKSAVVSAYIEQYRRQRVSINKSSVYYAGLIDALSQQSPEMLNQPFKQVLQILAILEYDFNNGQDKDALALKVLGNQQAVAQNKKRLGIY